MEIREFKTTNVRGGIKLPYQSPTTSVLALDYLEGVLAVLSWNDGWNNENQKPKETDPEDEEGRLSKTFQFEDLWADDTEEDDEI
jgi:hypothetical protein